MFLGTITLASCGPKKQVIEAAKEAIKSKTDYDEENNELLIYENSDNSLGDISIRLEPWESDESAITVITEIEFCYPYNQYVDDGELDLILYAKTDYRYNVEFSLGKYFFDSSSSHTLFAYIFGAKVGEDYEKGSDKYQVIGTTTYENNNDCPWTKGDCQVLFDSLLVLTFEGARKFFDENNLDFHTLYPNY